jgi:hypothetical protein
MKKYPIIIIVLLALTCMNSLATVTYYPGTHLLGGNIDVTFQSDSTMRYFEIGNGYFKIDNLRLNVSCTGTMDINISAFDSGSFLANDATVLRFNATYTSATATFRFTGNNSAALYSLYTDGSLTDTYEANGFSWTYAGWSEHDFEIELDGYRPVIDCDTVIAQYDVSLNSLNISWSAGAAADRYVIARNNASYPTSVTDDYEVYNGTNLYWNDTNVFGTRYFTLFGWNSTANTYSTGCDIAWGAVGVTVYNESSPWEQISPFGMLVSNVAGTTTFWNATCLTTHYLNYTDIPWGDNTIFKINATGYKQRTYYKDLAVSTFYNYTFLLPRVEVTVDPGEGDSGGDTVATQMYLISVIDERESAIPDAKLIFRTYNNHTSSYEEIGSFLTDGYGQGTIWLIPDTLYKVDITADEYEDSIGNDYIPNTAIFTKTFRLISEEGTYQPEDVYSEEIIFEGYVDRSANRLYINYSDAMEETINTSLYIYEYNYSTLATNSLLSQGRTGEDSFSVNLSINISHMHYAVIHINHETFGNVTQTLYFEGTHPTNDTLTTQSLTETLFELNYGTNPLGWSNVILFLFLVACYFSFGQQGAGIAVIIAGFLLLFINYIIGFNTILTTAAGGGIPLLHILMGILMLWRVHKKGGKP